MSKLDRHRHPAEGVLRWEAGEGAHATAGGRSRRLAAVLSLAMLAGATAYAATADWSTETTVSARLVIERRDTLPADAAFIEAQAKLLSSRDLLRRAAGELGIDDAFETHRASLPDRILSAIGIGGTAKLTSPEERLTDALATRFQAMPSGSGRSIDIRFQAEDVSLAARFVDRVVEDYTALQRSAGGVEARLQADPVPVAAREPIAPDAAAWLAVLAVLIGGFAPSAVRRWRRRSRAADIPEPEPLAVDPMELHPHPDDPPAAAEIAPAAAEGEAVQSRNAAGIDFGGRKRIAIATLGEGGDTHRLIEELTRDGGFEGVRIVVVDAGRRGSDHPGLSDLLAGDAAFADVIQRNPLSRAHEIGTGRRPLGPLVDDVDAVAMLIEALEQTYDLVLIDLGPLRADPAFTLFARLAGQLVLAGDADRGAVDTLLAALRRRGVTGIVRVPPLDGEVAAVA